MPIDMNEIEEVLFHEKEDRFPVGRAADAMPFDRRFRQCRRGKQRGSDGRHGEELSGQE